MRTHDNQLLQIDQLNVALGGRDIVDAVSLGVHRREVVALMGPNGCGKSTILRTVYRALRPTGGVVRVDGDDVQAMSFRRSARLVSALTQESSSDIDFTVDEVIAMGRLPHSGGGRLSERERALCEQAMVDMGVTHLRHRGMIGLSGGERQRVLIARALVQEPSLLVLDEPTNHLDMAHQVQLLSLLRRLGVGILVVLHDLNLAAAVCDRLLFVKQGQIVACGTPHELITPATVRQVFDTDVHVIPHPLNGAPQVLFELPHPHD